MEQRPDLPVGFLGLAAAGPDLLKTHLIEPAADPLYGCWVALERGAIPTQKGNVRVLDREQIEPQQMLKQLEIVPSRKRGFHLMPGGFVDVADHIRGQRIDRKQFVQIIALTGKLYA